MVVLMFRLSLVLWIPTGLLIQLSNPTNFSKISATCILTINSISMISVIMTGLLITFTKNKERWF